MKENIENSIAIFTKQRNYICPCNKSYLSYPALFTHIKQKHNGKAPGEIIIPKKTKKIVRTLQQIQTSIQVPVSDQQVFGERYFSRILRKEHQYNFKSNQHQKNNTLTNKNININIYEYNGKNQTKEYWLKYLKLYKILNQTQFINNVRINIWDQLQAFKQLQNFIDDSTKNGHMQIQKKQTMGYILIQFLNNVSNCTRSYEFEEILLLFSSLLEYIFYQNLTCSAINILSISILILRIMLRSLYAYVGLRIYGL